MFNFTCPSCANTLLFSSFAFVLFYLWVKYEFSYWKRRGVYSPPATFLIGHLGKVVLIKESFGVRLMKLYQLTKEHKYVGIHLGLKRTLLVNDLNMAKTILQKDHDHFNGHGFKRNKESDPLGEHLFNLDGEEWKRIRTKLTPTFTSSKMKYMFDTMLTCSDEMILHIKESVTSGDVIDIKEVIARFGTDVIGSCAFGIQTNSFKYPDAEFRRMGKKIFDPVFTKIVHDIWTILAPSTVPTKLVDMHNKELTEFFTKCVKETIEHRETNNIRKNDFLQLLIDMKNSDEKSGSHLTIDEIVPQVFIFFAAGFETSSTTATYAFLELAKHQNIQDKALEQIDKALEDNDGKITYEMINQMSYLTQIVNESLRMYPPLPFIFRKCNKNYKIAGKQTVIEKDTLVLISAIGIHRDPEYYPDPLRFEPDRFSPENIANRHPYSHIPFGEGPRICIGSRFGILQVKIALFEILRNFRVDLVKDASKPVEFDPKAFLLHTEGEMVLRLTRRSA